MPQRTAQGPTESAREHHHFVAALISFSQAARTPQALAPRPQAPQASSMPAPSTAPRILVADDQKDILEALKLLLKGEGYEVESATSPRAVLSALDKRDFDALLIDMN